MDPRDYEVNPADDIDLDTHEVHSVTGERIDNAAADRMARRAEQPVTGGQAPQRY
ncbi:hypothetical protein [Mycobacterium sp. 94-17]|uniref:hypothetical protein n=1 Tax=Mycobacterium sp. 94-17 TaxID=2986147 RepID=UPI002D1E52AE|nr:hypothetical protein [Mycobacterium sp. 94-17]MEB4208759.1 hypothetical protein [Mycobacterium sp. 94-17]